ncbi:MAG: phosphatidylglycerophosphatase A [Alphaproteobacteria bacterium]
MTDPTKPVPLSDPGVMIATVFGIGRIRPAPGTWGSLAALPLPLLAPAGFDPLLLIPAAALAFIIGCWAANRYQQLSGAHDAGEVVIDEVCGQWIALCLVALTPIAILAGFVLFRLFDIVKPWPIRWADKNIGGGFGVMLDDVLAGVAAAVCLYGIALIFGWPTRF